MTNKPGLKAVMFGLILGILLRRRRFVLSDAQRRQRHERDHDVSGRC